MLFAQERNHQRAAAMPVMMDMVKHAAAAGVMRSLEVHDLVFHSCRGMTFIDEGVLRCQTLTPGSARVKIRKGAADSIEFGAPVFCGRRAKWRTARLFRASHTARRRLNLRLRIVILFPVQNLF